MKRHALDLARRGFNVLPLHTPTDAGCSCLRPDCGSPGKHPRCLNGFYDATVDPAAIERWWGMWPDANIGIRTGDGLAVVDNDPRNGGSLLKLEDDYDIIRTMAARTGGGGDHLYLAGDLPTGKVPGYPGIDIKGEGGYVVAPPSLHASGRRYEWIPDQPTEPQPAPAWLVELLTPTEKEVGNGVAHFPTPGTTSPRYVAAAIEAECMAVASASEGERNETLNRAAFALGRFVATGEADPVAVHDALSAAARHAGLSEREIHLTIRSGFKARRAA